MSDEGHVIGGRWELGRLLGSGGTAEVFLARDRETGGQVAVKVASLVRSPRVEYARLVREFEVGRRLDHPGLVKLLELGTTLDGRHYLVMEYLEGRSLMEALAARTTLPLPLARTLALQMARAVGHYAANGLVHRDLKPANVMLVGPTDEAARAVITDFGLVKDPRCTALTASHTILGTPCYLSPEQICCGAVDVRSDLYQLGLIVYEMVSGRRAYDDPSVAAIVMKIVEGAMVPLAEVAPGLPGAWHRLVARCCAQRPEGRFEDAGALVRALEALPVEAGRPSPVPVPPPSPSPSPARVAPAALAVAAVLGLALGAAWSPRSSGPDASSAAARPGAPGLGVVDVAPWDDGLLLSWRAAPPAEGRALLRRAGGPGRSVPALTSTTGLSVAFLPSLPEDATEVTLVAGQGAAERTTRLSEWLRGEVARLVPLLEDVRPERLVQGLETHVKFSPEFDLARALGGAPDEQVERLARRRRLQEVRALFDARLLDGGFAPSVTRAARLARLVLGTRLLAPDERGRFYRAFLPLHRVRLFLRLMGVESPLLPASDLGDRGSAGGPFADAWDETPLLRRAQPPVTLGFTVPGASPGYLASRGFSASTTDVARLRAAEVRLVVAAEAWSTFRMQVNGAFEATLVVPAGAPGDVTLYQRLPVSALREGPNDVVVSREALYGRLRASPITVKELVLLTYR